MHVYDCQRHTKSQHLNVSRLILQLSLRNPPKPNVKLRMKMQLKQCRKALLQLRLSDQQFYLSTNVPLILEISQYSFFLSEFSMYDVNTMQK